LGVLDWFWTYKLAGHVHCIGWRPLRASQPCSALLCMLTPLTVNSVNGKVNSSAVWGGILSSTSKPRCEQSQVNVVQDAAED